MMLKQSPRALTPAMALITGAILLAVTVLPAQANKLPKDPMESMLYKVCKKEMLRGMTQELQSEQDKVLAKTMQTEFSEMAHEVCSCAAPKVKGAVVSSMNLPQDQAKAIIDKAAMAAMKDCL